MAKRIYWATVIKWLSRLGIPTTLIGGLFVYLSMLGSIEIHGYSDNMTCAGTLEDPCYAYFNFTPNEDIFIYPLGYDPWGRDSFLEFDPDVKEWKLQRKWGDYWRNIPLDKNCTGTWCGGLNNYENAFSYAFRKGKTYEIRIVAYKKHPYDKIKWSSLDGKIDPLWLPSLDYITKTSLGYRYYYPLEDKVLECKNYYDDVMLYSDCEEYPKEIITCTDCVNGTFGEKLTADDVFGLDYISIKTNLRTGEFIFNVTNPLPVPAMISYTFENFSNTVEDYTVEELSVGTKPIYNMTLVCDEYSNENETVYENCTYDGNIIRYINEWIQKGDPHTHMLNPGETKTIRQKVIFNKSSLEEEVLIDVIPHFSYLKGLEEVKLSQTKWTLYKSNNDSVLLNYRCEGDVLDNANGPNQGGANDFLVVGGGSATYTDAGNDAASGQHCEYGGSTFFELENKSIVETTFINHDYFICLWYNSTNSGGYGLPLAWGDRESTNTGTPGFFKIYYPNSVPNQMFARHNDNTASEITFFANVTVTNTAYNHYCFNYDSTNQIGEFFVNGIPYGRTSGAPHTIWNGVTYEIKHGADQGNLTNGATTNIFDELIIANTTWDAQDFKDLYDNNGVLAPAVVNNPPSCNQSGTNITVNENDFTLWILDENMSLPGNITCSDVDGDALTYTLSSGKNGTYGNFDNPNNDDLSYHVLANQSGGTDVVVISVSDGTDSIEVSAQVTVTPVNTAPWWDNIDNTTYEAKQNSDVPINLNASNYFRDVEDDKTPKNITIFTNETSVNCYMNTVNNFSVFCDSTNNFSGYIIVNLNGTDSLDLSATTNFEINITEINNPPWWDEVGNDTATNITENKNSPIDINMSYYFRDVENDRTPSNITISTNTTNVDCYMDTVSNFSIFCQGKNNFSGSYIITVTGFDFYGLEVTQSFENFVLFENQKPWWDEIGNSTANTLINDGNLQLVLSNTSQYWHDVEDGQAINNISVTTNTTLVQCVTWYGDIKNDTLYCKSIGNYQGPFEITLNGSDSGWNSATETFLALFKYLPNISLELDGINESRKYEYQTTANITVFADNGEICLSIDAIGYGEDYVCGNNSVNVDFPIGALSTNNFTTGILVVNSTCYQEFSNVSTECGGVDTGLYYCVDGAGSWFCTGGCKNLYDGDWSTYCTPDGPLTPYYVNYTKPVKSLGARWDVSTGATTPTIRNYTIPDDCFNHYDDLLELRIETTGPFYARSGNISCFNGTWNHLDATDDASVNEESITWDMSIEVLDGINTVNISFSNIESGDTNISLSDNITVSKFEFNISSLIANGDWPHNLQINILNDSSAELSFPGNLTNRTVSQRYFSNGKNEETLSYTTAGSKIRFLNLSTYFLNSNVNLSNGTITFTGGASNPDSLEFINYYRNTSNIEYNGTNATTPQWTWDDFTLGAIIGRWTGSYSTVNGQYIEILAKVQCQGVAYCVSEDSDQQSKTLASETLDFTRFSSIFLDVYLSAGGSVGYEDCERLPSAGASGGLWIRDKTSGGNVKLIKEVSGGGYGYRYPGGTEEDDRSIWEFRVTNDIIEIYDDGVFKDSFPYDATHQYEIYASGSANCHSYNQVSSASFRARIFYINAAGVVPIKTSNFTWSTGTYISDEIKTFASNINSAVLEWDALEPEGTSIDAYLSNDNGTTWEQTYNSITHIFSSAGTSIRYKFILNGTNVTDTDGDLSELPIILKSTLAIIKTYPTNITVDIGNDGEIEWSYNFTLTDADTTTATWPADSIREYMSTECVDTIDCLVPVSISIGTEGKLKYYNLNQNGTINTIQFLNDRNSILETLTSYSENNGTEFIIGAFNDGTTGDLILSDLDFRYIGDGNITITANVDGNENLTKERLTHNIMVRYSKFNVTYPNLVSEYYPLFYSASQVNATPYGQVIGWCYPWNRSAGLCLNESVPIFNISADAKKDNVEIYIKLNTTLPDCVKISVGDIAQENVIWLNTSAQLMNVGNISDLSGLQGNFSWTNLSDCNATELFSFQPVFCFDSLCDGCVKTRDWDNDTCEVIL